MWYLSGHFNEYEYEYEYMSSVSGPIPIGASLIIIINLKAGYSSGYTLLTVRATTVRTIGQYSLLPKHFSPVSTSLTVSLIPIDANGSYKEM